MEYSKYQNNIFSFMEESNQNLIIEAVAGSGKTTTILECAKRLPADKKIVVCAFNKSIQTELQRKLVGHNNIQVKTLHAIGWKACSNNKNKLQNGMNMDGDALFNKIKALCYKQTLNSAKLKWSLTLKVNKLLGFIKNTNLEEINKETLLELSDFYGIDFGWSKDVDLAELRKQLEDIDLDYQESKEIRETIKEITRKTEYSPSAVVRIVKEIIQWNLTNYSNFDDMIWLPVKHNFKYNEIDYIFIDEVQDLNKLQMDLIKTIIDDSTRVIGVGDKKQAIYGFRGALTDGMKDFESHFKAKHLPLSVCYRCPINVIEYVKEIVPEIEAKPDAIQGGGGLVLTTFMLDNVQPNDLVLCRTNSPLIKLLFKFMDKGMKAYVEGLEIGKNIKTRIKEFQSNSLQAHIAHNLSNIDSLSTKLEAEKSSQNYEKLIKLERSRDFCVMVMHVLENCKELSDHIHICDTYFGENKGPEYIKLSSVHKAKGLEATNVYIIHPEKMPHPMAKQEWEQDQEENLRYVAYTRAIENIYEVKTEDE